MALFPTDQLVEDNEWHDFTPTMESGYFSDSAKYKKISEHFVFIALNFHRSAAGATDGNVLTLPSNMCPPLFSAISVMAATSSYNFRTGVGGVGTNCKLRIYAPNTDVYYFYVAGVVPLV